VQADNRKMNVLGDQKLLIKEATDLVRLVGQDLALKRHGREFIALCPFHDDKRPSLTIVPQKQIYHCFVCKAGGDVFNWLMNYHKMDFRQALQHLADMAGIELERRDSGTSSGADAGGRAAASDDPAGRKRLLETNGQALAYFAALLKHPDDGAAARQYVETRRISPEMVERFQIGYAADAWDSMVKWMARRGLAQADFEAAGLIATRNRGEGHYDKLRHRLIFPICDALGRPIAFGGRKLRAEDEPKYLNSPETRLFNKSATLFGLHLAKQAIIKSTVAVIVEGYTDVIACHQHGAENVVATLGTALTAEHVAALRHYADKVVLLFDADEAGQKAADHAVELFLTGSLDVAIGVLPDGLDPADLLDRADGITAFQDAIGAAVGALDYQFARLRQRFNEAQTISAREAIATDHLRDLAQLGLNRSSPIRRAQILQQLADLLQMPLTEIDALLKEQSRRVRRAPAKVFERTDALAEGDAADLAQDTATDAQAAPREVASAAMRQAQQDLIGCLLHEPTWFAQPPGDGPGLDEAVTVAEFVSADYRDLYGRIYDRLSIADEPSAQRLSAELLADMAARDEQALAALATQAQQDVAARAPDGEAKERLLHGAVTALVAYGREQANRQLRRKVADGDGHGDEDQEDQLLRQIIEHGRNPNPVRIARFA
jgi:DNA primase